MGFKPYNTPSNRLVGCYYAEYHRYKKERTDFVSDFIVRKQLIKCVMHLHISHAGGAEPTLINVQFSMLSIIDRPIMGHGS